MIPCLITSFLVFIKSEQLTVPQISSTFKISFEHFCCCWPFLERQDLSMSLRLVSYSEKYCFFFSCLRVGIIALYQYVNLKFITVML